jgi:hypothetical protein
MDEEARKKEEARKNEEARKKEFLEAPRQRLNDGDDWKISSTTRKEKIWESSELPGVQVIERYTPGEKEWRNLSPLERQNKIFQELIKMEERLLRNSGINTSGIVYKPLSTPSRNRWDWVLDDGIDENGIDEDGLYEDITIEDSRRLKKEYTDFYEKTGLAGLDSWVTALPFSKKSTPQTILINDYIEMLAPLYVKRARAITNSTSSNPKEWRKKSSLVKEEIESEQNEIQSLIRHLMFFRDSLTGNIKEGQVGTSRVYLPKTGIPTLKGADFSVINTGNNTRKKSNKNTTPLVYSFRTKDLHKTGLKPAKLPTGIDEEATYKKVRFFVTYPGYYNLRTILSGRNTMIEILEAMLGYARKNYRVYYDNVLFAYLVATGQGERDEIKHNINIEQSKAYNAKKQIRADILERQGKTMAIQDILNDAARRAAKGFNNRAEAARAAAAARTAEAARTAAAASTIKPPTNTIEKLGEELNAMFRGLTISVNGEEEEKAAAASTIKPPTYTLEELGEELNAISRGRTISVNGERKEKAAASLVANPVAQASLAASPVAQASLAPSPAAQASPAASPEAQASLAPSPVAQASPAASPAASVKQMTFEKNINTIKALAEKIKSIMSSPKKEEPQNLLKTYRSDFGKKQITGVINSIKEHIDDKTIKARINRYEDQYKETINLTTSIRYERAIFHLERIKTQFNYITKDGDLFLEASAKKTMRGKWPTLWGGARKTRRAQKTRCRTRKTRR